MTSDQHRADARAEAERSADQDTRLTNEVIGELVLLSLVTAFFIYICVSMVSWTLSAALMPAIAVALGTPFLIWRSVRLIRVVVAPEKVRKQVRQIMDIGFDADVGTQEGALRRFLQICGAIAILYVGIWLLGFHIMIPLWLVLYLCWFGRVKIVNALIIAAVMYGYMTVLYDVVLGSFWSDPFLSEWLGNLN